MVFNNIINKIEIAPIVLRKLHDNQIFINFNSITKNNDLT